MARTGRPRRFEDEDVINGAREIFWRNGYAGTSMQTLKETLGILPGSLYAAYGAKHALFLRVLDSYIALQQRHTAQLLTEPPVLPALRETLTAVLSAAVEAPGRGCFLGNTATEALPGDHVATERIARAFAEQERAIRLALTAAQAAGEVRDDIDPSGQAQLLMALMQGLHVLARTEHDPQRLITAIDAALAGLSPHGERERASTSPKPDIATRRP